MKKHRRVGNTTSANFFTSQFKLKSTQFPKQSRQKKINTTFSSFRHQLFQQQPKNQSRYSSKDSKPFIEQLKFITSKDDDFKLPQSVTKRSRSKAKEQSRLKIEIKNNQLLEQHYQQVPPNKADADKKMPFYQFAATKRMKHPSMKNPLKQKLERSALQKFNEAIFKENQENQNVVGEKNAQLLYQLLKTTRINQFVQKKSKLNSQFSQSEDQHNQMPRRDTEIEERRSRKQSINDRQQESHMESEKDRKMKDVIKSKQNLFQTFEQKTNKIQTQSFRKPEIPKPKVPPPPAEQPKTDVIQFKKVVCDQTENQKFVSSQQESDFGQQLQQVSKIAYNPSLQSANPKKAQSVQQIQSKNIVLPENSIIKKESQKVKQSKLKSLQSEQEAGAKKKVHPQNKQPQPKQKQYEQSDLDNIPSVEAYQKPAAGKEVTTNKQRKDSSQFLSLNNNKIEMVLTTKHLDQQPVKTTPKISPPPKLSNVLPTKSVPKTVSHNVDDDELESIQLGNEKDKKQAQPPKTHKQISQAQPIKQEQPKKEKVSTGTTPTNPAPPQQLTEKQKQIPQEQESSGGIEDQLTYYIQRIEDIGQYRINSKDVYNDKSIDKQLLQIHKICAYYMAHQFLYLAQWTCNFFKGSSFPTDFYSITPDELNELKENGVLDEQIENLSNNIQESKKLLKKCYEECKAFLKKEEQILIIDGKTNYHIRCCAFLIKEFKKVYDLFQKAPKNGVMIRRCVYLIELYCVLKLLNGQELKDYEEFEDIQNPIQHIETYKKLLLSL